MDFKYSDVEAMPDGHIDVTLFNRSGTHFGKRAPRTPFAGKVEDACGVRILCAYRRNPGTGKRVHERGDPAARLSRNALDDQS